MIKAEIIQPIQGDRMSKFLQIDHSMRMLEEQVNVLIKTLDELQNCQKPDTDEVKSSQKSFIELYNTLSDRISYQTDNICSIRDRLRELLF